VRRRGPALVTAALVAPALLAGCEVGVRPTTGQLEPFQVQGGQFFPGELPGSDAGPAVVAINSADNLVFPGQAGKQLSGDVAAGATSILMRFADLGTGYWSVPVGSPDPQMAGALTWSASCDFSWSIPPGTHDLLFAAMGLDGVAGPAQKNPYLFQSATPAGKVVISLAWDSGADLDLHLVTPGGQELDPKHPTTAPLDAGATPPPGTGLLDRDSNGNCVPDGFRREDVVFAEAPPPGSYLVRVDMFSACGAPSADFVLTVTADGAVAKTVKGRLLDTDADGGGLGSGLFVAQLDL
jgi:hypothetical protein